MSSVLTLLILVRPTRNLNSNIIQYLNYLSAGMEFIFTVNKY